MNLGKEPLQTDLSPRVIELSDVTPSTQSQPEEEKISQEMRAALVKALNLSDI